MATSSLFLRRASPQRQIILNRTSNILSSTSMWWNNLWPTTATTTSTNSHLQHQVEALRSAESKLLDLAQQFNIDNDIGHEFDVRLHDTKIPHSAIPTIKRHGCLIRQQPNDDDDSTSESEDDYVIHGVEISAKKKQPQKEESTTTSVPLVMLHGYMNGSSYFYRNFAGLSRYFPSIYSLDLLGWGLSSRPVELFDYDHPSPVEQTEDVFCESLEAWRKQNRIDKIVLAGHSMGGYLSVAYCERYPQNVERLVLISPAGVPDQPPAAWEERKKKQSFSTKMVFNAFQIMFDSQVITPGTILRTLPEEKSMSMVHDYITKRLPSITDPYEQRSLADYLYYNAVLPGCAEYCVGRLLTSPFLIAKQPLLHRIPKLQVPHVSFLYGSHDWMDFTGGLKTELRCEGLRQQGLSAPEVGVYRVNQAGHLVMLDNWKAFNAGFGLATGFEEGSSLLQDKKAWRIKEDGPPPTKLCPRADMPTGIVEQNNEFSRRPTTNVPTATAAAAS